jgi:sigma-B regulation protein RsbU (phosphoserine phosphatase)
VLIVATDGFLEARNAQRDIFGFDQLLTLIQKVAHKSAREITHACFAAIDTFEAGYPQDDDQTFIAIKVQSSDTH